MRSRAALAGGVSAVIDPPRDVGAVYTDRSVCYGPPSGRQTCLPHALPRRNPMKIAVLGTGIVGRTIAGRSPTSATTSTIGTRDPEATLARTDPTRMGNPPFAAWHAEHADGRAWPPSPTRRRRRELVVNATGGAASHRRAGRGRRRQPRRQGRCSTSPTRWTSRAASRPRCSSRTPTPSASRSSARSPTPGWSSRSTP